MDQSLIPRSKLSIHGADFLIPDQTRRLLWISDGDSSDCAIGMNIVIRFDFDEGVKMLHNNCDPSTIFTRLPIEDPKDKGSVEKLPYYPSYLEATPKQRWTYLNWLRDTSQPIDIGYVFMYYYGLERHLILGNFEDAKEDILFLRGHHDNSSFDSYSETALLFSCVYRKKTELFLHLVKQLDITADQDVFLHYKNLVCQGLGAREIMDMASRLHLRNRNYLRKQPDVFEESLQDAIQEKYGRSDYPFCDRFPIDTLPKAQVITFANISFPEKVRTPELGSYFLCSPFKKEVLSLLESAHERTKTKLSVRRKTQRKTL